MDGRIVVIGSGIGGLSTALALGRAGHEVLVLERDALPTSGDAEEAFAAERRGAPQAHQTHGFLARLVVEMRRHFPDVLAALYDVGCVTVPARNNLGDPRPGDEDLAVLIVRRTTLEWLLREAALAQPGVELRPSCGVAGLSHHLVDDVPMIDGVQLADGRLIRASVVVDASGRRSTVPAMLGTLGVDVGEEVHESGLMYLSRWYRVPGDVEVPLDEKLGGDLGHLKFLAVPGDGRTLSITLAVRVADAELRAHLSEPDGFERAVRMLEGPEPLLRRRTAGADRHGATDGGTAEPDAALPRRRRRAPRVGAARRGRQPHVHEPALRPRVLARPRPGAAARRRARDPRRRRGGPRPGVRGRLSSRDRALVPLVGRDGRRRRRPRNRWQ